MTNNVRINVRMRSTFMLPLLQWRSSTYYIFCVCVCVCVCVCLALYYIAPHYTVVCVPSACTAFFHIIS